MAFPLLNKNKYDKCIKQNLLNNHVGVKMPLSTENLVMLFGVLFGISESLALIPSVKANSIFQVIATVLKALAGKS